MPDRIWRSPLDRREVVIEVGGTRRHVISGETHLPSEEAVERARALVQEAGYGVLSEIDVKAKLQ